MSSKKWDVWPPPKDGGSSIACDAAELDTMLYLAATIGLDQGWLHVAFGVKPYRNVRGTIKFRDWEQGSFKWPQDADHVLALVRDFSESFDAYICPYVLSTRARSKGNSVIRTLLHCDGDDGVDLEKARNIPGAFVVGSGTDGHGHVYVPLTRSVPRHQHEALCRGVAVYLGAKDPKFSDNDVLRPPGTWNFKPRADDENAAPLPVTWLKRPTGDRVDPRELAALFGVELTDAPLPRKRKDKRQSKSRGGGSLVSFEIEPFDLWRYPQVRHALAKVTRDRSADTMHVVGACARSGLTDANARWAVRLRRDLAGRLDERDDDDVGRCFERARTRGQKYFLAEGLRRGQQ